MIEKASGLTSTKGAKVKIPCFYGIILSRNQATTIENPSGRRSLDIMRNTATHRGFCLVVALAGILASGQSKVTRADTSVTSSAYSSDSGLTAEVNSLWNWIVSSVGELMGTSNASNPPCPSRICGGGGGGGNPDR